MPYRSVTHAGVTLLCFPPYDVVFARLSAERLAALSTRDPDLLQADLRATYPDATVRRREALASLGRGEAWYAYRDGRYSPFTSEEPWWEDPGVARLEIDADGRYVAGNDAALELIGVDAEGLATLRSGRPHRSGDASQRPLGLAAPAGCRRAALHGRAWSPRAGGGSRSSTGSCWTRRARDGTCRTCGSCPRTRSSRRTQAATG